jgi:hypothetical protein
MISDPQNASIHLILESLAETRASFLIVGDRIKELALTSSTKRIVTKPTVALLLA